MHQSTKNDKLLAELSGIRNKTGAFHIHLIVGARLDVELVVDEAPRRRLCHLKVVTCS